MALGLEIVLLEEAAGPNRQDRTGNVSEVAPPHGSHVPGTSEDVHDHAGGSA